MEVVNESIFVSTIRSFCKVFFGAIGLFAAFFVVQIVYSMFTNPFAEDENTSMVLQPDLNGEYNHSMSSPVVLQIHIDGVIGNPQGGGVDSMSIEHILLDSRRGYLAGDRVKAILLYVNTPGGSALDSENIYQMLKTYKEKHKTPIYAFVNGLCASGGMYITSAADKLYATGPSVIGSVGVIMGPFFNVSDTMARYGVQSTTLTEGKDKDTLSPFRPWKPDETADWQAIMDSSYQRFLTTVTTARTRLDRDKLVNVYGAKVFEAGQAQTYGYIDVADATYQSTLTDLLAAASIDSQKPYQIVELKAKQPWYTPVRGFLNGQIEHTFNLDNKKQAGLLNF